MMLRASSGYGNLPEAPMYYGSPQPPLPLDFAKRYLSLKHASPQTVLVRDQSSK